MNVPLTVSVGSKGKPPMFSHPRWQPIGASAPQSIRGAFLIGKEFFAKGIFVSCILPTPFPFPGRSLLIAAFNRESCCKTVPRGHKGIKTVSPASSLLSCSRGLAPRLFKPLLSGPDFTAGGHHKAGNQAGLNKKGNLICPTET
jgi:hypothetical protein